MSWWGLKAATHGLILFAVSDGLCVMGFMEHCSALWPGRQKLHFSGAYCIAAFLFL